MAKINLYTYVVRASRGDKKAQRYLATRSDEVAEKVNKRLKRLEDRNLTSYAYQELINFTSSEYDHSIRLQKSDSKYLEDDYYAMRRQIMIGEHFLKQKTSTVEGQLSTLDKRTASFVNRGLFGIDAEGNPIEPASHRKARNFMKFIHDSGIENMFDYGSSEVLIEAIYTAYNRGLSRQQISSIITKYDAIKENTELTGLYANDQLTSAIMEEAIEPMVQRLTGRRGSTYSELMMRRARYAANKLPEPLRRRGKKRGV